VEAHRGGLVDARFDRRLLVAEVPEGIRRDGDPVARRQRRARRRGLRGPGRRRQRYASGRRGSRLTEELTALQLIDSGLGTFGALAMSVKLGQLLAGAAVHLGTGRRASEDFLEHL